MDLPERERKHVPLIGIQQARRDLHQGCRNKDSDGGSLEKIGKTLDRRRLKKIGENDVQLAEDQREASDTGGDVNTLAQLVERLRAGGKDHPGQRILQKMAV